MNSFVQKEARLQLPTLAVGVVATLLLWLVPNDFHTGTQYANAWWFQLMLYLALFTPPLIALMIALNSFGREFSGGTFSTLLAQPVPRARVWWTKIAVLASALLLLLGLWLASTTLHFREFLAQPDARDTPVVRTAVVFTLVVFSGGLWTTLIFRQVAAAFWFTMLVPGFLIVIVNHQFYDEALAGQPQPRLAQAVAVALSLYSLAGFVFARWLFLRAQDVPWIGGAIALPWRREPALRLFTKRDRRRWRPRAALWFKEFGLHRSQFVIAGVLATAHLAVIIARYLNHGFKESPMTEFLATYFWGLWVAMPWLVGSAAVAEERRLGTMEAQLCLPARRRTQFLIKLTGTLMISVLFGAAMPLLFEGTSILPDWHIERSDNFALFTPEGNLIVLGNVLRLVSLWLPFLVLAAIAVTTASISFYVSTFSRNTLQAIAPATLGILAFYMWWFAAPRFYGNPIWHGWLIHYVGAPVLLPTLLGLAYWNFTQVRAGGPVWRRNSLVLGGAFAFVLLATGLIYHRAWEWLTPIEPKHGPAFLKPGGSVILNAAGSGWMARLPDGRIWMSRFAWLVTQTAPQFPDFEKRKDIWRSGEILEGTNWVALAANWRELLAIKTDGSLWVTETPLAWTSDSWKVVPTPGPTRFIRLGQDNDWKNVKITGAIGFLLKTNGTLWRLGTNQTVGMKGWVAFRESQPTQLGTNTDWVRIAADNYQRAFLTKADGTVWTSQPAFQQAKEKVVFDSQVTLHRSAVYEALPGERLIEMPREHGLCYASVRNDGTFAITTSWERKSGTNEFTLVPKPIPLGRDKNWIAAVATLPGDIVTLKSDGTLWKWAFSSDPVRHPDTATAMRLGENADWVGLANSPNQVIALATDGSLWAWEFAPRSSVSPRPFPPELAPTRRPLLIGQIPRSGSL